ncbi:MAG: DUF2442 domain-containing protein [Deltaproteobacteria bacterium]|nr:DUF2442 domain-containing protein [Deltaproteobacteria bacterium]
MVKPIKVKPLPSYKIWVKFSDGAEGTADLSHLAGKGVFSSWKKKGEFEKVHIDNESGTVAWNHEIDLCPDTLYMQITGKNSLHA